jgi:hypothetical protein
MNKPCICCGDPIVCHFYDYINLQLIKKQMCFVCNIWDERSKMSDRDRKNIVIADGRWYTISEDHVGEPGFSGAEFKFQVGNDVIASRNVWFGGDIPAHFRDKIKDNAVLIE